MASILATGKQRAAKSSQVQVGGIILAFASWNADVDGVDLPTNNFLDYDPATDQSYSEGILGFLGCTGQYGGDWDAGVNPLDDPPGLYPRDDLANIQFYTSIVDVVFWDFAYQRIRKSSSSGEVNGKVTFTVGYMNQGIFVFPAGSV